MPTSASRAQYAQHFRVVLAPLLFVCSSCAYVGVAGRILLQFRVAGMMKPIAAAAEDEARAEASIAVGEVSISSTANSMTRVARTSKCRSY